MALESWSVLQEKNTTTHGLALQRHHRRAGRERAAQGLPVSAMADRVAGRRAMEGQAAVVAGRQAGDGWW